MEKCKRIELRVSEDFYDMLKYLAEKNRCTRTDFIVKKVLNPKTEVISLSERTDEERKLMHSISNNLNQTARTVNQIAKDYRLNENKPLDQYNEYLKDIIQKLNEMLPMFHILDVYEAERAKQLSNSGYINKKEYLDPEVLEYLEKIDPFYLQDILKSEGRDV